MLYDYGGDKIRTVCGQLATYSTSVYKDVKAHLEASFKHETRCAIVLAARPNGDEKLVDYAARLKLLYRAAGLEAGKEDFMVLILIILYAQSVELRNNAMEKEVTLKLLLEWQAMNDINEALDKVESWAEFKVNRIIEPRQGRNNRSSFKGRRSESEKRRYNDTKQKAEGCYFCGGNFPHAGLCPAHAKQCKHCGKDNHTEGVCLIKKRGAKEDRKSVFNIVETSGSDSGSDNRPRVMVKLNGVHIEHVVDTGSSLNILTRKSYESLRIKPDLKKYNRHLYAYNAETPAPVLGTFTVAAEANSIKLDVLYIVLEEDAPHSDNLLGYDTLRDFKLIIIASVKTNKRVPKESSEDAKESIKAALPLLLEDRFGKIPNVKVSIHTDSTVMPKQRRHFPKTYCLIPSTQKKLTWMLTNDIMEPIPEGTVITHVSPMHPVEKANYDPNH